MKLFKRILLAGVALILLLGLGAYFVIKFAMPPAKIRQVIQEQGSKALGREVTVGKSEFAFSPI